MKREAALFGAIGLGPLAWFSNLEANFALAPHACTGAGKLPLYAVSLAALLLAVTAGSYSLLQYHVPERNAAGESDPSRPRRRALALAGIGISGLCFLLVLAQAIPNFMLVGCE